MKKINYDNYFAQHYKYTFTKQDILAFQQWFYPQWVKIQQLVKLKPGSNILEIGTGAGGFYALLDRKKKFRYLGLELDTKAVEFANTYFSTSVFIHTPIEDLKVRKKYNYIFAFEVLEHVQNPLVVLENIHDLLAPGGIFIGTTPFPFTKNIMADKTHLFVLHPENWRRLFSTVGFAKIALHPMSFFPFLWRIHKKLNIILPFYVLLPGFISTTLFIVKKK